MIVALTSTEPSESIGIPTSDNRIMLRKEVVVIYNIVKMEGGMEFKRRWEASDAKFYYIMLYIILYKS